MLKNTLDTVGSAIGLFVLSPLLGAVALIVKVKLGSPILFKQTRPGLNGKPFQIYKFRTMTYCCDQNGRLLPDCDRLTPFGRWLRRTSLDELPEFFNIFKGEMSIVGPRPLLMQYLHRYTPEQSRRHDVKPGLTGWAQVNGRNTVSFSNRLKLDVWYVDNRSFFLDLKIILLTFKSVFKSEGVIVDQEVQEIDDLGLYDINIGVQEDM